MTHNDNTIKGAEIMAGDGGYEIGTEERYKEFVEKRNYINTELVQPKKEEDNGKAS